MSRKVSHDVLRRMVSPPPPAPEDVPITSSRAMRLAVTRAADKTHAMPVSVTGIEEEVRDLDAMLEAIAPDMLLVGMVQDQVLMGLAALDTQLRGALIEVQTVGSVLPGPPDDRPPTGTDATMAEPLLEAILAHLSETATRTPLDGWGQGLSPMGRVESTRAAGLILPERPYRIVTMSIDLQVDGRQGKLLMALPDHLTLSKPVEGPKVDVDWSARFQTAVNAAPVRLTAELHRFKASLIAVETMAVDQVIPLTGCHVASVKLRAADGRAVATARLGQSGGMRAIRIEQADLPGMEDLADLTGEASPGLAMMSAPNSADLDMGGSMDFSDENDVSLDFGMGAAPNLASSEAFDGAEAGSDVEDGFASSEVAAAESDETTRMLDEMEAAIAIDDAEGSDAAAPLDWSDELGPSQTED